MDSQHRFSGHRHQLPAVITLILIGVVLAACQPTPRPTPPFGSISELPTFDARDSDALCRELDTAWSHDWPRAIDDLEKLRLRQAQCNGQDVAPKLYPAYYNYGVSLEARGNLDEAVHAYRNALAVNPQGSEAALALKKHDLLTPAPLATCTEDQVKTALAAVPAHIPQGAGDFVRILGNKFAIKDQVYIVKGVNYYPVRAPWRRFLAESDLSVVEHELDLIHEVGFNTLRIFLDYDALFDCPGSGAVPRPDAFMRLDGVIRLAAARGFHLLVTLNDLPDLTIRPLYLYPESAAAQTAYIVKRYRDESAILGWDVRNEGDIDYTRNGFSPSIVLNWLTQSSAAIKQLDGKHLITAGWLDGAQVTASSVDFLSFHHWSISQNLESRVTALRVYTQKPILLEETGFSTLGGDEQQQAAMLQNVIAASNSADLAGWMIWTAFDFPTDVTCVPPACPSTDNGEHHFGLWHSDYTPKPAVEMIRKLR